MNAQSPLESSFMARLRRISMATAAGALAISALSISAASAQTTSHKTPTLSSLEKQLKALEVPASSSTPLSEAGSSLFYPLAAEWAQKFPYASTIPVTAAAGGSGAGVNGAIAGTTNIGASDPYLPPSDTTVVNIPEVVSAQMVNYNIPGLSTKIHLKLNATVLNQIYEGTITNWDSPAITALNKGVKIPSTPIVVIHRSDSSGDTFLFSTYLNAGYKQSFLRTATSGGPQNLVNWPSVPGELAEKGNTGMLQVCATTPGCVAYIGVSYLNSAVSSSHLGEAQLQNASGKYLLPVASTINAEVAGMKAMPASGAVNLIFLPKVANGYPIVNFEYAIVQRAQSSATVAKAIQSFLAWGMDPTGGASAANLSFVHFQPLPANALAVAVNLLKSIS